MKSEKDFRIWYEKELRTAGAFCEYMSSMVRQGVPDVFVTHLGISSWHELKFVNELPARATSGVLVKHRFTGPQRMFMKEHAKHGGLALGVVGFRVGDVPGPNRAPPISVAFFLPHHIGRDGDITREQLHAARAEAPGSGFGARVLSVIKDLRHEELDHGQLRFRGL
jgi:hypothetical protein